MQFKQGWIHDPKAVEEAMQDLPFPVVGDCYDLIKDTGKGKTVLLYEYVNKLLGAYPLRKQTVGDCVSQSTAGAIDNLTCFEIVRLKQPEEWIAEASSEVIYGGSRVVIGNGRLGSGDGSLNIWAAKYVNQYGILVRQKYDFADLTQYSGTRARDWGYRGFPKDKIISLSKNNIVKTISRVDSIEQARDLLANGYPIIIAGNYGFSSTRDKYGFARRSGSWAHSMLLNAVDDAGIDAGGRPGCLCCNSWGKWNTGPKRLNQPEGSFWMDYQDVELYLKYGDCWALSDFDGFEKKTLEWDIF